MKTIFLIFKQAGRKFNMRPVVLIIFLALFFPRASLSQEPRLNLSRYRHILKDTLARVDINVLQTNNQRRNVNSSLTDFRLTNNIRSAVIRNGTKVRPVESKGTVNQNGVTRTLRGLVLPELYIGSLATGNKPVIFQIFIDTIQPLIYDNSNKSYKGTFSIVLLEDSESVLEGRKLNEPIPVEISVGTRAHAEPALAQIDHTNLPSTFISITDESTNDPVPVMIKTNFKPTGYQTSLKKEAILRIETPSRSVQGWGVQTIPVSISLQAYNSTDSVEVTVSTDKGTVEPLKIKFTKNSSGTVRLTSEGKGNATVFVSSPGFLGDQKVFVFVTPWMFIFFAFLGSLVGSLVRYKMIENKKKPFTEIGFGILAGFAFAVLYYVLGIEVISMKLSHALNEFAVFGISFLGAVFWSKIYDAIKNSLVG